jgi:GNAT superfamily N-acetyltransferase
MSITVRPASEEDAVAACNVLRRSIRELCVADHGHDNRVLSAWLANKTPENVRAWITSPARFSVVAVEGSTVCGFGMLQRDGEIQLCYLVPEVQHRGAGKLMLRALEEHAAGWGLTGLFLTSTVTAKRCYERNGYVQTGEPTSVYGLERAYPMSKGIALTPR